MAKQGFSYYKAETDRFQDIKIKRLKKRHGCAGYAVYQYVLNEIYRVRGYFLRFTEDEEFDLAEYWNLPEDMVTEIVNYCAEIGLFNRQLWQEKKVLTARSIQSRYLDICKVCKKAPAIEEGIRLVVMEQTAPAAAPLPQLFPMAEQSPMHIVPKEVDEPQPSPTVVNEAVPPIQGIGTAVLAEIEKRETKRISEEFQKVPEVSGNFPEESDKSIKSYVSEITPSSNSPREEADKASLAQEKKRLDNLLRSMSICKEDARWIYTIEGIEAAESPVWQLADEIKSSGGRLTVCSYLLPSLRALVQAGRLVVRQQTFDATEELRRMLAAAKVPSYDVGKIITAAAGQEAVLREAIEEVRRSKGKITMPGRYLLSKLRKMPPAKAS